MTTDTGGQAAPNPSAATRKRRNAARQRSGWCGADLTPLPDQSRGNAAKAALTVVWDGLGRGVTPGSIEVLETLRMIGLRT